MLARLVIQDFVLIDRLSVGFEKGLHAFTGETGAGKSIILDALGLALGARGDAGLIRTGAAQASVTAEFDAPFSKELLALAQEQGLLLEEPLLLRRVLTRDGKTRAFLNDQPITISFLRQMGERLLEIHGQFETQGLLEPSAHRNLLDSFGGLLSLKNDVANHYAAWREAEKAYEEALTQRKRAEDEEEFLRAAYHELADLAPEAGEIDRLAEKRGQLQNREKIIEGLAAAQNALDGEKSATSYLSQTGKALARIADKARDVQDILNIVDRAAHDLAEASRLLAHLLGSLENDESTLDKIEERLFALRAAARKHGVPAEELPDLQEKLKTRLALLEDQGDSLRHLLKQQTASRQAFEKAALTLSDARKKYALLLAEGVMKELPPLKLEKAVFVAEVAPLPPEQWNENGMDRVMFLAATNKGSAAGPIQKIASGGELARFMLALKVVLAATDPVPTLVFDEVDTGIGGATASAVGERLARLAQDVQVLVVTHSPQVAAHADHQLRVIKRGKGEVPTTRIDILDKTERLEEIARMLSGDKITEAAKQAAQSLLDEGARKPAKARKKAAS